MKLKTLVFTLFLVSASSFAQKVKYSKEEIKKMEQYLFNEGFNAPSVKNFYRNIKGRNNTQRFLQQNRYEKRSDFRGYPERQHF